MTPADVRWIGDRALLVGYATLDEVLAANAALADAPLSGQCDLVPAARTLLVRFDTPRQARTARERLATLDAPAIDRQAGREITIDVVYDGEDLADVAAHTGLSVDALIAAHTGQRWQAAFGGFAPGFFYMIGEDERLQVPRRDSPRTRVPAGAVGLAGVFSAVYPKASPGGWQLIGRTDARLWDLDRDEPALLAAGDHVRYRAVDRLAGASPAPDATAISIDDDDETAAPALIVVEPGLQALLQDTGRPGQAHRGVSVSGAADEAAARQANRLVGNSSDTAVMETVLGGLTVQARGDLVIALTGAPGGATVQGTHRAWPVATGRPFALGDGQCLSLATPDYGLRRYLAVRGGFALAPVLGSRASDTLSGIGPAPLVAGQALAIGHAAPSRIVGHAEPGTLAPPADDDITRLRVVLGPRDDWFDDESRQRFLRQAWRAGDQSNRVGLRLAAADDDAPATLTRARDDELPSEGCVAGAVQVPPAGTPVLFLRDHPVTGGYPVIAVVVAADLDRAGQLAPGDRLQFIAVDPATAAPIEDRP